MTDRFIAINCNGAGRVGVFDCLIEKWVVEPEYSWDQSKAMAKALNHNPDLDPDELTRIVEAA